MVVQEELTKAKFLEYYTKRLLFDYLGVVELGTEKRIYALTRAGMSHSSDTFKVVYAVV